MADKSKKFILMSLGAIKIQELLKDKFDYRSQGYCPQHKCFITEGPDGCSDCPGFLEKYHLLTRDKSGKCKILTKKQEKQFGFGSPEDCRWNYKWIGLSTQNQLQNLMEGDCFEQLHKLICYIQNEQIFHKNRRITKKYGHCKSWEQLWLSFCQKVLYNEAWNDKEKKWIKL